MGIDDKAQNKGEELGGKAKETAGKLTDDEQLEAEGKLDEPEFATARTGVESLNMPGDDNSRGVRLGFYVQFREIFSEETQRAFNGEQPMQAALDTAKMRGDELLRRFEQTYQGVELP